MYFADTYRADLGLRLRLGAGAMRNERVFADCSDQPGRPDGSCVDADGCLWNAEYGGSRVVRHTPDGRIDRVVELPVSNIDVLLLWRQGSRYPLYLYRAPAPDARATGARAARRRLLRCRPGVRGLPEARFAA